MYLNNILILIFILSIYFLFKKFFKWYNERQRILKYLKKIPGENGLPILGSILDFQGPPSVILDKTYEFIQKMNKYNYPVMKIWIGPYVLVYLPSPEVQKQILESTKEITKGSTYDLLREWLLDGLLTSSGDKWKYRRRIITPNFHFKMLCEYHVIFNEESKVLVKILEKFKNTGKEVKVLGYMKRCLFDMIMSRFSLKNLYNKKLMLGTAFGHNLGCQFDSENSYLRAVEGFNEMSYLASVNIFYKNKFLLYLSGKGFKKDRYLKILESFADKLIKLKHKEYLKEKEKGGEIKHKTFISMLLELYENNEISMEGIKEEVNTIIIGGFDTSSTTMAWLLWCLATHPDIQEKVYQEIFDIFGENERVVTHEDIVRMPYFEMVFKEVLRRFSIVSIMTRRLQNDIRIGEYTIPKGIDVAIGPFLSHMNDKVFPDPYKFDPDRFLPENSANRSAYDFIPFSAGPRNCIGQKYAAHNVKILSIWILRRYRVRANYPFEYLKMVPQIVTNSDKDYPIIFDSRI
uniref:Cytochrome P450 n=1 Tax=Strongyloides papillosus TaxID=174720 RepID=A0A0N5B5A0_STREA